MIVKNSFLYTNAKGRRSLTPFTWSLLGIFAILVLVTTFGITKANANRSVVVATPQPITLATVTPSVPEPTLEMQTDGGCPKDPLQWDFVDISPDSNYKRIEPTCVYDGLAKTVAWRVLSSTYGYDIADAGVMLGFSDALGGNLPAPFHELQKLVLRPFQGHELIAIAPMFPPMDRGLRMWEVGANKQILSGTYMLQGCFRTFDIVGNERQYIWDLYERYSYEAICQVSYDTQPSGWYIADYGNRIIYSDKLAIGRALVYFGYDKSARTWYFLGMSGQNIPASEANSMAAEYSLMQEWYGAPTWNHSWFQSYNIVASPLPEGWEERNTNSDLQALMARAAQAEP